MHSRIFKVQEFLKEEYERINEFDFENNGFIDGFHDYVKDEGEAYDEDNYQWFLKTSLGQVFEAFRDKENHLCIKANKNDLMDYFNGQIEKAKGLLNDSIKNWWQVQNIINGDIAGFYFYFGSCGGGYYTDTEFVLHLIKVMKRENKEEVELRLEGNLDYHC